MIGRTWYQQGRPPNRTKPKSVKKKWSQNQKILSIQLTSFDLRLLSRSKFVSPKVIVPILLPEIFCSIYIEGWLDFFVRSANQVRASLRSGLGDWYRITLVFLTSQKHPGISSIPIH